MERETIWLTALLATSLFSVTLAGPTNKHWMPYSLVGDLSGAEQADASSCGVYSTAAVSADAAACSTIGRDILEAGGSATDATIAGYICQGVVQCQSDGIGGGFSLVIYDIPRDSDTGERVLVALNAREVAPFATERDMFNGTESEKARGGRAIALMGEVKGFEEAWKAFGRLPWRDLFQPTIDLARNGFAVTWSLGNAIQSSENDIREFEGLRNVFVKEDGSLYQEGDILTMPDLANTLEVIAEEGADAFYSGSLSQAIVDDVNEMGANYVLEDLAQYEVLWSEPVARYLPNQDVTMYGVPPPLAGLSMGFFLKLVDGLDISEDTEDGLFYHRVAEALKFTIARQLRIADPSEEFATDELLQLIEAMSSDEYVDLIRNKINDGSVYDDLNDYYPRLVGEDSQLPSGTTHLNAIAQDGGVVSATGTVGSLFGSKILGRRTGIVFNNAMNLFNLPTQSDFPENYIAPRKRPRSNTCPIMVLDRDGELVVSAGASGGIRIVSSTAQVTVNNLWRTSDLQASTDNARVHHNMNVNNDVLINDPLPQDIVESMESRGHNLVERGASETLGVVQSLSRVTCTEAAEPCIQACSDWRKGGAPDGF